MSMVTGGTLPQSRKFRPDMRPPAGGDIGGRSIPAPFIYIGWGHVFEHAGSALASTVIGASIPPYQTRLASAVGVVVSTFAATRRIVSARSTFMAAWAAKPYPKVRIVAINRVKPRICNL